MRSYFERLLLALAFLSAPLGAQDLAAWRGAWIADVDDSRAVMYLVLRDGAVSGSSISGTSVSGTSVSGTSVSGTSVSGTSVSGTYCTNCANPDFLAFVDDGKLDDAGLHFNLYFSPGDTAFVAPAEARLVGAELHLTVQPPGASEWTLTLRRAPPQVVPPPVADARPNQPAPGRARELPGAAETVTAEKVQGLWLWGTGPTKQYFIFKRHKDGVRGMVCGPCDSAQDFAPLENIRLEGSNFHFEIVHEDNGIGFEEHGPFSNVTDAKISLNEMHMTTYSSFDPNGRKYEMTLLGPVQYMPVVEVQQP